MNEFVVAFMGLLAVMGVLIYGPHWSFRWVYLPVLILVPNLLIIKVSGLPDITAHHSAMIGLWMGAFVTGKARHLIPRWRWFDAWAILAALSFSTSYWIFTDFKGFYHRFPIYLLDWTFPYLAVRALLSNRKELQKALVSLALAIVILALLAAYECRFAYRLGYAFWTEIGCHFEVISHYGSWRWGFLRAVSVFYGPIEMGTMFATVTPLIYLGALFNSRQKKTPVHCGTRWCNRMHNFLISRPHSRPTGCGILVLC